MHLRVKKVAKQCFWLLSLVVCIFQANLAAAHAVITEYSLKLTPIRAHQADKVELSFNSRVELGLAQVFLVSKGDKHTPLQISQGNKQGQIVVQLPALELGDYALKFKVFAADGHLTEDLIHFSVAL
jgi:methionine-rich copper-binding protein CopC